MWRVFALTASLAVRAQTLSLSSCTASPLGLSRNVPGSLGGRAFFDYANHGNPDVFSLSLLPLLMAGAWRFESNVRRPEFVGF